jgi:hypothetical protein
MDDKHYNVIQLHSSDDDCEGEECEVEPIPSYSDLQSSFGTIRSVGTHKHQKFQIGGF